MNGGSLRTNGAIVPQDSTGCKEPMTSCRLYNTANPVLLDFKSSVFDTSIHVFVMSSTQSGADTNAESQATAARQGDKAPSTTFVSMTGPSASTSVGAGQGSMPDRVQVGTQVFLRLR
jgi:hypothetical protein